MPFCGSCGSPVEGSFCARCGASVGGAGAPRPEAPPPPAAGAGAGGLTDNVAGALCYLLGVVTGILFLVLAPYNQNRTVRFHAWQSIFMFLAVFVLIIVLSVTGIVLSFVPILGAIVGFLLYLILWLGSLVLWLYLMFKTYQNEKVVLPVIGPLAEKQA